MKEPGRGRTIERAVSLSKDLGFFSEMESYCLRLQDYSTYFLVKKANTSLDERLRERERQRIGWKKVRKRLS